MNFYEILKTKKLGRGSPDYWTQLFAEHVGGKGEWKVAGVLPLTFTAKGDTAVDWVIYGNDDNGTENLFDKNDISELNAYINTNGVVTSSSVNRTLIISVEPSTTYTIKMSRIPITSTDNARLALYSTQPEISSSGTVVGFVSAGRDINITFTSGVNDYYLGFKFCNVETSSYQDQLDTIMLVKGSTAPDHYIPYQQGAGERTKNMFDMDDYFVKAFVKSNVIFTKSGNDLKITITDTNDPYVNGSVGNSSVLNKNFRDGLMPVQAGDTLTFSCTTSAPIYHYISFVDSNYNGVADWLKSNKSTNTFTIPQNCKYILIRFANSQMTVNQEYTISNIMLVEGSTAPDRYIPYGYQIPLTVSQAGQTDKTADIYIGDNPLTEGETVSKASTGVDIELFEGENTVSTTLYNKPDMEIKYK